VTDQRDIISADTQAAQKRIQAKEQALLALRGEAEKAKNDAESSLLNEQGRTSARQVFEAKVRELQTRQNEFQQDRQNTESTLNARAQAMQSNVLDDVKPVIEAVAKDKGADLVLNSGFNPTGVLFADASLDVTEEVIKRLNAAYTPKPKAVPAPETTPAPAPAAPAPAAVR
jgi:outer membrane protein